MGMSNYILDLEEQFDAKVEDAVKESEHVSEAMAIADAAGETEKVQFVQVIVRD